MEIYKGTLVLIKEVLSAEGAKGGKETNYRFGLVHGPVSDSANPDDFFVRISDGSVCTIGRKDLFSVAQLAGLKKNLQVEHISIEEALNIALPEILLKLMADYADY